ncbi:MAG: DUF3368 domain-containing protein [Chlorobiales bacterium]|jgi:predicted nucleic acid-binding protein|nr:DUF3368 domain-containing protein [Chlorobiales bacterium]
MSNLVIADTSCLIVFQKIGQTNLLRSLYDSITITMEVKAEFGESLPDWIKVADVIDKKRLDILELYLDKGEASAITLGLENENSLLLIDERKGRKVATELGLKIIGSLGILIQAKERGFINSLKEEIEKLKSVDFRVSELLIKQILEKYEK